MKKYLFPTLNGKWEMVYQPKIQNALPYIEARIKYFMPVELIDVEEIQRVIDYVHVNVNRDCSPEEVHQLVEQIKNLFRDAVDNMPHYERPYKERGVYHVP